MTIVLAALLGAAAPAPAPMPRQPGPPTLPDPSLPASRRPSSRLPPPGLPEPASQAGVRRASSGQHADPAAPMAAERSETITYQLRLPPKNERGPVAIAIIKGYLLFQGKLQGRDAWMLLDNRSIPSAIDPAFARAAGLRVDALGGVFRTPHGSVPKQMVRDARLSVPNGVDITTTGMAAIDLAPISQAIGHRVDAVFGGDYLSGLAIIVSPGTRTIRFGIGGSAQAPPSFPKVTLEGERPQLMLDVGGKPVKVTLDLGDNGMLTLSPDAWRRVAPVGTTLSSTTSMGLDGQPFLVDRGVLPAVTLGRFTRREVPVRVAPDTTGIGDGDGRMGIGFLADCDFLLDIKGGGLWVIPRLTGAAAPSGSRSAEPAPSPKP